MAGGEPRLGTTATYMRHNDHGTTHLSTEIDILHDLINDEYRVFSEGSVRKWSKFGLEDHSQWFVLAFAGACALGSLYGFLQGAWPFGIVEAIWCVVAGRRWWLRGDRR